MATAVDPNPGIKSERHPLDTTCINTIRTLAMDAVQAANSGHPGTPMAMAPVAYYLWQYVLRFDPADPVWPNRDRFVLSAGHASMLLYSLLHLTGVKAVSKDYEPLGEPSVPLEEIERFRQLHSRCPGHPEYRLTSGVETTTGPLGQGAANSVGMAAAERWMAAHYNRPGFEKLIDFNVYALCGDGDMMEGISSEAASLAGHWKLSNLCWIYDNNHITIEGNTALAFTEDVATRFLAYGWNVTARQRRQRPRPARASLHDLSKHERPAHADHRRQPYRLGCAPQARYERGPRRAARRRRGQAHQACLRLARGRQVLCPRRRLRSLSTRASASAASNFATPGSPTSIATRRNIPTWPTSSIASSTASFPTAGTKTCRSFPPTPRESASRASSGKVLNAIAKNVPWLIGGAADLAPSTKTYMTFEGAGDFEAGSYGGRNFHFGVREHAMGAIMNGMALVKVRPFGAGFLIFSDYGRMPIRLAALDGNPGHLHLHARLDRRRRRRADPPAGRAARVTAGDPRHDHHPPVRRQ